MDEHVRESDEAVGVSVADTGVSRRAQRTRFHQAGSTWVRRVSETLNEANARVREGSENGQPSEEGRTHGCCRHRSLPQGDERWVVLSIQASVERARHTMMRHVSKAQKQWETSAWSFSHRRCACEADARAALERKQKGIPA
ncbi:MAG TPA: hypothetical protein VGF67_25250 [Ktedonobacteraceae bacterium]|jgi:transposase